MRLPQSTIKRALLGLAAMAALLVMATPLLIHPLINSHPVKARLAQEIKRYSDIDLQPETTEFFLAPVPGVRFLDTDIEFSDQFRLFIKSSEILIDLGQLIQGKLAISRIEIQGPKLVHSPSPPQASQQEEPKGSPFRFQMPVQDVDELFSLFPDSQDDLEIVVKQVQTDYFSSMNARFMVFKDNRSLDFNARIRGIDVRHGQIPLFDAATHNLIQFIRAGDLAVEMRLNRDNILSGQLSLVRPEVGLFGLKDSPLQSTGLDLSFSLSEASAQASLSPSDFVYPKGRVGIEFKHDEKRTILAFTGSDIDIGKAREVCLPILGQEDVVETLFDILRSGNARNIDVTFDAPSLDNLFHGQNLRLSGNAESATVKIPEVPIIAENVNGTATMADGILHIKNPRGIVRANVIQDGILDIDLVNHKDVGFKGQFHLAADLSTLPKTLQDLLPDTTLALEMKHIKKIEGRAEAVLELEMAPESRDLHVRVNASGISAAADYSLVPLPLSITDGEFSYETDLIRIRALDGAIGSSPVGLDQAQIRLGASPEIHIENGSGTLVLEEFMPWLDTIPEIMNLVSPAQDFKGRMDIGRLDLQGPMFSPGQWTFNVSGAVSGVDIGFGKDKSTGISGLSSKFSANQNKLDLTRLGADITDLSWLAHAVSPAYLSSIQMPLRLKDVGIKERKGEDFFHGRIKTPGGPEFSIDLTGESLSDLTPTLIMVKDPPITDALIIPYADPDKPMISFEGKLNTRTLEKVLIENSELYNRLIALTAGDPITCSAEASSHINLDAHRINLDSLLSGRQDSEAPASQAPPKNVRPLLAQKSMTVKTDQLIYLDRQFEDVQAQVSFGPEYTEIEINSAVLCGLSAPGQLRIPHGPDTRKMSTEFDISSTGDKDISTSLACLLGTESVIEGGYTFKAEITGNDLIENIARRQNGTLSFESSRGRIYKATLLSRVLSVLNILGATDLRQEGFGYKTITVKADVEDSVVHLNRAYIDADNMAIIASGWLAPMDDRLDVTFLVAPLKTIDTIIQHIPVVNTILSGRLVSFPAKASGKISDPTVVPLHPSAVGTGLINLFGDLLKAPVRLIQGDPDTHD